MSTELELIRASLKTAMDHGRVQNNEDESNKGRADVYPQPEGRKPGTLDAKWGDAPPPPVTHGTAVEREAKNGRGEMIDRLFDSPKSSAPAEQKEMRELFTNADEGHPHSPMLQHGRAKTAADETLIDKVMRVVKFV
jgi:hypothetical protein